MVLVIAVIIVEEVVVGLVVGVVVVEVEAPAAAIIFRPVILI